MTKANDDRTVPLEGHDPGGAASRKWRRFTGALVILFIVALPALIYIPVVYYMGKAQAPEQCGAMLKSLGQALYLYTQSNGGAFPDSFQTLAINDPDLFPGMFFCPWTREYTIFPRESPLIDVLKAGTPRISYIYTGNGQTITSPPAAILAYEPLENHGSGSNVLFVDGHIEFLEKSMAKRFIAELQAGHNPPRAEMLK